MKNFTTLFIILLFVTFGYSQGYVNLISETFDENTLPEGWSTGNFNGASGTHDWSFGSSSFPTGQTTTYDFSTNAAIFDDDDAGNGSHDVRGLTHEGIDASNYHNLIIGFEYALKTITPDDVKLGKLVVIIKGATTSGWVNFETFNTDTEATYVELDLETFLVSNSIDRSNLRIGFLWDDEDSWGWGVGIGEVYLSGQMNNDECANAFPLEVGGIYSDCDNPILTTNNGTTSSAPTNGTPGCQYGGDDIWFTFVAPQAGAIDIVVPVISDWSSMCHAVYSSCGDETPIGDCQSNYDINNSDNLPSITTHLGLDPGQTYYLRVWEYENNEHGDLSFCIKESDKCGAPTNLVLEEQETNYVNFSWSDPNYEQSYHEWKVVRLSDGEIIQSATGVMELYASIYNLTSNTDYRFDVRGECGPDDYSDWVSVGFTTSACSSPSNLSISAVTTEGFTASWNGYSPFAWAVTKGMTTIQTGNSESATVDISGLPASTEPYVFGVWTICGDNQSTYILSDDILLQEEVSCYAPVSLGPDDNDATWIAFTWTDGDNDEPYWDWKLFKTSDNSQVASGNGIADPDYFQIMNLSSSTEYRLELRAECQADDYSAWVTAVNSTLACPTVTGLETSNITTNSFDVTWNNYSDIDFTFSLTAGGTTIEAGTLEEGSSLSFEDLEEYTGPFIFSVQSACGDGLSDMVSTEINLLPLNVQDLELVGYSNFTISPNPTNDKVNVHFVADDITDATITVSNVFGMQVSRLPISIKKGQNKYSVNLTSFANGVYFISIANEQGTMSKRVIKQ